MIRPEHVPTITTVWITITFIITYTISVHNGHVYYFLPYISDTGALPPESCYFAQMLNVGPYLFSTMFLRYKQIEQTAELLHLKNVHKWNTLSKWCAAIACMGLDLVANFQETTVLIPHIIGAVLTFAMGSLYFIIQTILSYLLIKGMKGSPHRLGKFTFLLRIALSASFMPLFIITTAASMISFLEFDGEHIYYWTPQNNLVGTFTEWGIVLLMLVYIMTFSNELKALKYHKIEFSVNVV